MTDERVIKISGVQNIRDLGGLVGLDGRKVVKNKLIRSSRLINLQQDGIDYFKDINLSLIVDLRTIMEATARPNPEIDGIKYIRVKVLSETEEGMGKVFGMVAHAPNEEVALVQLYQNGFSMGPLYMDLVNMDCAVEGMSTALKIIAAHPEDQAILWHCNGGKDRTGTLTAFLLTILGVPQDVILDDFVMTNQFFTKECNHLKEVARSMTDDPRVIEGMEEIAGVSRKNLQAALEFAAEQYGSVMNYITDKLMITQDEIQQIRDKYLEKTTTEE